MCIRDEARKKMEGEEPEIFQLECSCYFYGERITKGGKGFMNTRRSMGGRKYYGETVRRDFEVKAGG